MLFFCVWNHLKNDFFFNNLSYRFKHEQDIFLIFNTQNFKKNCNIIFLKFLQSPFSNGRFIPSTLYLFINVSFLLFFADLFRFNLDLLRLLLHIVSICYFLCGKFLVALSGFLSCQENLYMIRHNLDLLYDI